MFDEFLDELRRRQAGEPPRDDSSRPPGGNDGDDDGDRDGNDDDGDRDERPGGSSGNDERRPPRPIRPLRSTGGPSMRRQVLTVVAILVAIFVVLMLAIGIELWTDAIWYTSVGYDAVFWRRLWVQVGLFAFGAVVVLLVLLGNLWLAGRLLPPASGDGGTLRTLIDRLNEAAERTQEARTGPPWENPTRRRRGAAIDVTPGDMPDPTPLGRGIIAVVAILIALTIAGSIAGDWQGILLWLNRVPYAPAGANRRRRPGVRQGHRLLPVRSSASCASSRRRSSPCSSRRSSSPARAIWSAAWPAALSSAPRSGSISACWRA
jgi:hypothetical protein